jgi:hypothetical protein
MDAAEIEICSKESLCMQCRRRHAAAEIARGVRVLARDGASLAQILQFVETAYDAENISIEREQRGGSHG